MYLLMIKYYGQTDKNKQTNFGNAPRYVYLIK